jgi:hypothetical protein
MASKGSRKAKKALKKMHPAYLVIAVLALVAGLALGYFGASFVNGGDVLEVKGNKITEVEASEQVVYKDEGIKYVSGGKDMSDKYEILSTNMDMSADGTFTGTATEDLFIVYKVTEGRAADQTVYRVFRVKNTGGEA